ncbi:DOMON domain-containing protein FRRS1L [Lagopus leucura]|uniref:DOMON domain-containing protein FRRS1L n=1 Tax=Lagopus leucura TaxID=30410 RepID=UPI001C67B6A4|nr:DOMON domain-containing protein FRRS1L [Lagopus leucura]
MLGRSVVWETARKSDGGVYRIVKKPCDGVTGYPFPTAPPVDPFAKIRVDDCGKTKGCFRYGKPGCNAETCDYFLSYRRIGADVEFELSADTDGWVAVGFSSDKKMGGDDVMACVHDDNGRVRIQHFYNVGQWAKEIQRNPARDEEGVFENNRVTCRFKRPVYVPREETIVDLHLNWYYLFAWGPAIQGSITRHDIDSPPVSERVVSIYKYEDIFMPSAAYQTFSSPFCLLLIVALTFYLLMGTP